MSRHHPHKGRSPEKQPEPAAIPQVLAPPPDLSKDVYKALEAGEAKQRTIRALRDTILKFKGVLGVILLLLLLAWARTLPRDQILSILFNALGSEFTTLRQSWYLVLAAWFAPWVGAMVPYLCWMIFDRLTERSIMPRLTRRQRVKARYQPKSLLQRLPTPVLPRPIHSLLERILLVAGGAVSGYVAAALMVWLGSTLSPIVLFVLCLSSFVGLAGMILLTGYLTVLWAGAGLIVGIAAVKLYLG